MPVMYSALLFVHSWLRWMVFALAVLAVLRAIAGWRSKKLFTAEDDKAGRVFTILFDVQFTVGLVLYAAVSPFTRVAMSDFGAAMRDSMLRYWAVEHIFGMIVALALAHVGRARSRRLLDPVAKHKAAAIFFGLALLIMLISIPWPFMPAGRPLFRFAF